VGRISVPSKSNLPDLSEHQGWRNVNSKVNICKLWISLKCLLKAILKLGIAEAGHTTFKIQRLVKDDAEVFWRIDFPIEQRRAREARQR